MTFDICLPPRAPELGRYGKYNWEEAAFALYTLVGDKVPLQDVVSVLEQQWLEQGNETHIVRAAAAKAEFDTLHEIVQAHAGLDKGIRRHSDGSAVCDLEWWPIAFIVVVREDWRIPGGLLFVYADDEKDCKMDSFFVNVEDAYMLLSGLNCGDEDLAACKVTYGHPS